ncbi:MAG: recombinase family protein [Anaerotruncus sp.]|jgi:DNA invertase Pin-like site-specific DNA recombinase|nr:recombinase family protein [Anaerotruncus sp.]
MQTRTFGYARVSSKSQFEDRQLLSMEEYAILPQNLFVDHQSGKDFNRPAYRRMLRKLHKGDLLVVTSIDRLGRNYQEMIEQWRILTRQKEVDIVVLDMPLLDTRASRDLVGTLISDLVLQLLSFVAENERISIRQRQADGIAAARQRGVRFGRPNRMSEFSDAEQIIELLCKQKISMSQACSLLDVSERTIYRWKAAALQAQESV